MILKRLLLVFILNVSVSFAQKKQDILFTVNNEPVTTQEFITVFNKNRDIVTEENKKTVEEYLELYINYKLKLTEAYQLKLDTVKRYKRELEKYRKQLIKPYLKDANITKALLKEAHERLKKEVKVSHILVMLKPKASPTDTLTAYNKITDLRNKILKGEVFSDVAKEFSEDPSAKKNGGDLGYFSAFQMVYPFENAAYANNLGDISKPFRTSFGYHILKVEDVRTSKGEVQVAHIMIKNDSIKPNYAEEQIQDIYTKLQQGEPFGVMAQKFSDDRSSAMKGGQLDKFSSSRMIEPFSSISFALEKENDISKPFETVYGWHIVKLIKKYPVGSFEELEPQLIKKIEKSERAYAAGKSVADKLKKEYTIQFNEALKNQFLKGQSDKLTENSNNTIFSINDKKVSLRELLTYNSSQKNKALLTTFNDFLDDKIIDYYKDNLEHTNKEFANTLKEYKDGLLLFDLLQLKIWKKSEQDSAGLHNFYNSNKDSYMHSKRLDVIIARCTNKEKAALVKKYLEANKSIESIKELVNKKPTIHVLFSKGIVGLKSKKLPKDFNVTTGVSNVYTEGKNQYVVVKVLKVLAPIQKDFNEAKGLVMNDYQDYLEKQWIKNLRANNTIKINKKALKRLTKEYAN